MLQNWTLEGAIVDLKAVPEDGDLVVIGMDVRIRILDVYRQQFVRDFLYQCEGMSKLLQFRGLVESEGHKRDLYITCDRFGGIHQWECLNEKQRDQWASNYHNKVGVQTGQQDSPIQEV